MPADVLPVVLFIIDARSNMLEVNKVDNVTWLEVVDDADHDDDDIQHIK